MEAIPSRFFENDIILFDYLISMTLDDYEEYIESLPNEFVKKNFR